MYLCLVFIDYFGVHRLERSVNRGNKHHEEDDDRIRSPPFTLTLNSLQD